MTWILTATGKKFDLLNPTPDMVCIEDIAYALSGIARLTGHANSVEHLSSGFRVAAMSQQLDHLHDATYTVAHHSILVANLLPREYKFDGLMHDATEAYIGDISIPLKRLLGEQIESIENRIHAAIAEKFGLCKLLATEAAVKRADLVALATERFLFMPHHDEQWEVIADIPPAHSDNLPLSVNSTSRRDVLTEFLNLFAVLVRA